MAMVGLCHHIPVGFGWWEWAHVSPFPCRSPAVVLVMSVVELPHTVFQATVNNELPFLIVNVYIHKNKMPF